MPPSWQLSGRICRSPDIRKLSNTIAILKMQIIKSWGKSKFLPRYFFLENFHELQSKFSKPLGMFSETYTVSGLKRYESRKHPETLFQPFWAVSRQVGNLWWFFWRNWAFSATWTRKIGVFNTIVHEKTKEVSVNFFRSPFRNYVTLNVISKSQ